MTDGRKETGIEELRRAVNALGYCNESVLMRVGSAERVLNVARAMWASGWDVYPDQWTPTQLETAAAKGAAGAPKFEERPDRLHALDVADCICRACRDERREMRLDLFEADEEEPFITVSLEEFMEDNEGLVTHEHLVSLRNSDRLAFGGGSCPVVFVEVSR